MFLHVAAHDVCQPYPGRLGYYPGMAMASWVVVGLSVVAACSGGGGDGPVVVHVPSAGLRVLFNEADGSLSASVTSDASATATAVIHTGASVTVIPCDPCGPSQYPGEVTMVRALQPGDEITIVHSPVSSSLGFATVVVPDFPGAIAYSVATPCGEAVSTGRSHSILYQMESDCQSGDMTLIAVPIMDTSTYAPFEYFATQEGVPFNNNSVTTITDTWHPDLDATATITNAPAGSNIEHVRGVPHLRGQYVRVTGVAANGEAVLPLRAPVAKQVMVKTTVAGPGGLQVIRQVIDGTKPGYRLDVGAVLLPSAKATLDAPTEQVSLSTDRTAPIDFVMVSFTKTLFETCIPPQGPDGGGGCVMFTWSIFGPAIEDFTLPEIPPDAPDILPRTGTTPVTVTLGESDGLAGYRAVRADVWSAYDECLTDAPRQRGTLSRASM